MSAQNPLRFLALGDSYTIGEAVLEEERWPMQLKALMNESGIDLGTPEIIATTGWTTDELQSAINERNPQGPYDLVSLLIGVNNQYRAYPIENYEKEFEQLLQQAIAYADGKSNKVVVVSIPDWGVTPFAADRDRAQIAKEIDVFNASNKAISKKYAVHYVDITPGSRDASTAVDLVASDGLHPSGKEYSKWANAVFNEMKSVLESK